MSRAVNIGLSPNLEADDLRLAWQVLLNGAERNAKSQLIKWFETYFPGFEVIPFNSGRSAEWAIIKALELTKDDEVLYQDFTCVAVPNSLEWAGVKAVSVATQKGSFNMDLADLQQKITLHSRAVIVQHTFGQAVDLREIKQICDRKGLTLIEDCAHALGATYHKQKLGTFGQIAFFSLGRDKVVSSVFGGVAITSDAKLAKKLRQIEENLPENSWAWVTQQLLHPILTWVFLPWYNSGWGKLGLVAAQKMHLLSKAVYETERHGGQPGCFPAKYSSKLAQLGVHQLQKLERFNSHRRQIARAYFEQLAGTDFKLPPQSEEDIYLRFTVVHLRARELYLRAKLERKWILGDWYKSAIPVLNLPTYPSFTIQQANELCDQLKLWLASKR